MKRLIALILTILITAALCSCDLFSVGNIVRRFTGETRPVYTDMPLSGGGVEPGFHEDENGFLILNRPEYVKSAQYDPLTTPYSYLIEKARAEAQKVFDSDPDLNKPENAILKQRVLETASAQRKGEIS